MGKVSYGFTAINDYYYFQAVVNVKPCNKAYNPCLISLQQIAEHLLKHVVETEFELDSNIKSLLHSHSLLKLVKQVKQHYPDIVKSIKPLALLDTCYFAARYPGNDYIQYDFDDYKQGIDEMLSILKWFIFETDINTVLPVCNSIKNLEDKVERFEKDRQLLWDLLSLDLPKLKED